jgi:N-acetylmuramoyl-L-alanine amidase
MTATSFIPDSNCVQRIVPAANWNVRREGLKPNLLLLHYTGMRSAEASIALLASEESGVSCHYVIGEDGTVTQMVPESLRAWHAGVSYWGGIEDINSCSIGIEIQNPGHDAGYPEFQDEQMRSVEALCLDIIERHRILPWRVLAHSDVAPGRKIDPGEKFDWARLAEKGVGHWTPPMPIEGGPAMGRDSEGPEVLQLQEKLHAYGYGVPCSGRFCERTELVVAAFQRHFRRDLVDGRADLSTCKTLDALLAALPAA